MYNSPVKQYSHYIILVVTILLVYRMFYYVKFSGYTSLMGVIALLIYIMMFFRSLSSYRNRSFKIEFGIMLSTMITYLLSIVLFDQPPSVISQYLIPLSVIPYFFLVHNKINTHVVEKVLITIAVVYILCWLYQVTQIPNIVFGDRAVLENDRGFARFYIVTKEHLPFLLFYFLSCYSLKNKLLFIVLVFVTFGIIILHVGRQMIVWSGLLALLYFIYMNREKAKKIILFAIICYVAFIILANNFTVLNNLIDLTNDSQGGVNELGSNNIRFEAMRKFIFDFNDSLVTILFGNGFSLEGTKLSYKYLDYSNHGYYIQDVGFIGLYVTQGLVSVFLYIVLLYKAIFKYKVSKEYIYIKFYLLYIVLSYLGSHSLTSNLIFVLLAIYILKKNSLESYSIIKRKRYSDTKLSNL